jgi:hypothetical protein
MTHGLKQVQTIHYLTKLKIKCSTMRTFTDFTSISNGQVGETSTPLQHFAYSHPHM